MARVVVVEHPQTLSDYAAIAHLAGAAAALEAAAAPVARRLAGRTVWMINSTAKGGGVAELLPGMVQLLRDVGISTQWAVIESARPEFFDLTKHIHNLLHGVGTARLGESERELYEAVNRENLEGLVEHIRPGDVVVVHDPQPLPLGPLLRDTLGVSIIWRCHIGLDESTAATRAAWSFLEPFAREYEHAVFSAAEYIPPFLAERATVIQPGIDPLSSKNRDMHLHELVRVLANSALTTTTGPVLRPPFGQLAQRLQPDGTFRPAIWPEDIGLVVRPIVTQISRWDRLKGFMPLLRAFAELKGRVRLRGRDYGAMHRRRLEIVRLVLAGPEPVGVADDPEAVEVLEELKREYLALDGTIQSDIAIVTLPMQAPRENALMVNALQRASSLVVQNSLREGFGLTVAEAMWKRIPVLSSARACGPRYQVRDGVDGRLVADPEDTDALADTLVEMLADPAKAEERGRAAQHQVHQNFLVFNQLGRWMDVLGSVALA